MSLDAARRIADTVLYEGYILYPYRASHGKNASGVRWQFGVLAPQRHTDANPLPPGAMQPAGTVSGAVETWCQQTECIVEGADGSTVTTLAGGPELYRGPVVADLDLDGQQEIILGKGVFDAADRRRRALRHVGRGRRDGVRCHLRTGRPLHRPPRRSGRSAGERGDRAAP